MLSISYSLHLNRFGSDPQPLALFATDPLCEVISRIMKNYLDASLAMQWLGFSPSVLGECGVGLAGALETAIEQPQGIVGLGLHRIKRDRSSIFVNRLRVAPLFF